MKPAFVLVDFENVQPASIGALDATAFSIMFLVGEKQRNMNIDVVQALSLSGIRCKIIRIEGNGRNALDFHIAYYIGRLSKEHPGSAFHIISKDTGFDPLIGHLGKEFKIDCKRWSAITEIPSVRAVHPNPSPAPRQAAKPGPKPMPKQKVKVSDLANEMIENLEKRTTARPASTTSLAGAIKSHFRARNLTEAEVDAIIEELRKRGKLSVEAGKVTYLPG